MKVLAITQARIGSSRLPNKILKTVNGQSLLEMHLSRILKSNKITDFKVATTNETDSDKIVHISEKLGVKTFKGSLNNVLERFYFAAKDDNPDWIVRLTSDCPLIDAVEIDKVIEFAISNDIDYASNALEPTFPDGLDTEVFKYSALQEAYTNAKLQSEFEHVTSYIWKNSTYMGGKLFKSDCLKNDVDYSHIRLTVDTNDDFELIKEVVTKLGYDKPWKIYVDAIINDKKLLKINSHIKRNEGYSKSIEKDK